MGGEKEYRVKFSKKYNTAIPEMIFLSDSPEEAAAAAALIWIMKKEQEDKQNES